MVNFTTKNPAQWINPSGQGFVDIVGFQNFQDNLGNFIITNSGNQIVTNPIQSFTKYPALWVGTGV